MSADSPLPCPEYLEYPAPTAEQTAAVRAWYESIFAHHQIVIRDIRMYYGHYRTLLGLRESLEEQLDYLAHVWSGMQEGDPDLPPLTAPAPHPDDVPL